VPRPARIRQIGSLAEIARQLRDQAFDDLMRRGRQLGDAQLADEHLGQRRIVVLPVLGNELFVVEAVAIAHPPTKCLERPRDRCDGDARDREGAQRDMIVLYLLATRREQAVNPLGLRCRRDVVLPERVEELGGGHITTACE
jgi:hypothetical protein